MSSDYGRKAPPHEEAATIPPKVWRFLTNLSDDAVQDDHFASAFAWWLVAPSVLPLATRRERYEREFAARHGLHRHHDFYALYIVAGGHGTHIINGEPLGMARGDVYLLAPGALHDYRVTDFVEVDALYFLPDVFSAAQNLSLAGSGGLENLFGPGQSRAQSGRLHLSPTRHSVILQSIFEMRRDLDEASPLSLEMARAALFGLLGRLVMWSRDTTGASSRRRMNAKIGLEGVLEFCEERFHEPLSIAQLASLMHLTPGHFSAVFAREMGMAPTLYLRQVRLERAQHLLRTSRHSVGEIAALSGFGSPAFFARSFRQAFGTTALEYRRAHAQNEERLSS